MGRNVPQLRFPEFTAEWEEKTLRGICDIKMCKRVMKHDTAPTGEIPFFKIGTLGGEPDAYISRALFEELKAKYNYPLTGEVMMTCSGTTGNCIQFDGEEAYYQDSNIVWVSNDEKIYNNDFLYHFFKQYKWNALEGGTIKRIYTNDIYNANIPTPCKKEQEKISQFLSKYDKLIRNQEEKISALKERKQGLLKKIFTQQVRFKDQDGNDYPAWEEKTLGDICTGFEYGMNESAVEYNGQHKYIRITDIDEDTHKFIDGNVSPEKGICDKYRVTKNSILFARTGASTGKTYLYNENDGELYYAGFLIMATVKNEYNSYFVYSQTLTERYKQWVSVMSVRSGQPGINAQEYKTYKIYSPCKEEQDKIAEILLKFDKKIEIEQEILSNMQEFKKGLLQKMFI